MKPTVGLIGMRGMVGSVLIKRMQEEEDFNLIKPVFFSGSQVGLPVPHFAHLCYRDAYDLSELARMDIILSAQGGEYTEKIYDPLRKTGWQGYFIDASSYLRLRTEARICLDPVNKTQLKMALKLGVKTFAGGNCTVSLMLMALSDVLASGKVECVQASTYQAASGAGMAGMSALLLQMQKLAQLSQPYLNPPDFNLLDEKLSLYCKENHPEEVMGGLLAGSLLPWIDTDLGGGKSREEAKMLPEAVRIMGWDDQAIVPMDTICVRVGALRCHSQAILLKLKTACTESEFTELIQSNNPFVKVIANNKAESLKYLTPAAVSGTLDIAVGRLRKLDLPGHYWSLFTVGDQLLWGAAEPLRRMLRMILTECA